MDHGERLRFATFEFDPESGELTSRDTVTRLAPQPARVLSALAERPGEVVTRSELQAVVWGEGTHVDYDQSLNFCIREIRKALGESAGEPRFIETFPKRGYRWIAPANGSAASRRPRPGQRRWRPAAVLLAGIAAGMVLGHEVSASPLHDRAVEWAHRVLEVPSDSCPLG